MLKERCNVRSRAPGKPLRESRAAGQQGHATGKQDSFHGEFLKIERFSDSGRNCTFGTTPRFRSTIYILDDSSGNGERS